MNKNLKKLIACSLTISALSAFMPTMNFNLMTTKAYAASNELTSLKLKTSSGSTIKTYSDDDYKSKNEVDDDEIKASDTYYAKTSSSKIKISTSGADYVRVFKGTSNSTKGVKTNSSISLSSGTNTIIVRIYSEDPGTVKYSDTSKKVSEYKIKVKYTGSSSDSDDKNGEVYLKSLTLSDGNLSFSKKTSSYNINVAESVKEIKITAKPDCDSDEYDDYEVRIDGTEVDEDDKFRKTVSLSKGKNEIKVTVEDDDDNKRTYTLNITRGGTTTNTTKNTTSSIPNTATNVSTIKVNQWVQANGKWQYNDSTGNPIKNSWFADRNYGKTYYLQADGTMSTGWLNNNGKWYYLGTDGAMRTGWILDGGKYYYLYADGTMAYNTTINGYKLSSSGAWVK